MNLVETLRTGKPKIRRPIARHLGSGGDGWVSSEYVKHLLLSYINAPCEDAACMPAQEDLLADDWEVSE